jgi:hypothetical protein
MSHVVYVSVRPPVGYFFASLSMVLLSFRFCSPLEASRPVLQLAWNLHVQRKLQVPPGNH